MQGYLNLGDALGGGTLGAKIGELIALTVAEATQVLPGNTPACAPVLQLIATLGAGGKVTVTVVVAEAVNVPPVTVTLAETLPAVL